MLSSGFAGAPITKYLLFYIVASAVFTTATDTKHYLYINVVPHIWRYKQTWRLITWALCYTNSTEVLFASMTLYQLRVVERLWGSRKFASFLFATLPYTVLLPPLLLTFILRPFSHNYMNHLPSGPTAILFALLAQYHAAVPYTYRYRIATSSAAPANNDEEPTGILLTSKSTSYLLPLQLALSQLPGSLVPAAVGWLVGYAWRAELFLFPSTRWRIPEWVYGGVKGGPRESERVEELRRRMEDDAAQASGVQGGTGADGRAGARRRPLGTAILDRFRGAF